MASSSSSHSKRYHVFPSFHGPDVRRRFLSHLHNHFASKGITTFKDQKMERGHTIGPELVQAVRESRLSIVLLSKNYAFSSWCLDELVEILKCKEDQRQIVMTIFYDVDPSDVRKQRGDFGSAFEKTCEGKTEEVKQRWIKALTDVAEIAGEHSLNWANEAEMIQKIATDVSKKLNVTPSSDFEGMVGLQAHLKEMHSLIRLECNEVKMIGIWGPAGIDCVIGLPHLVDLIVQNCPNLVSIPALSPSLESLNANECASLKRVCCSFHNPIKVLTFYNSLKLNESRRGIIQQSVHKYICLPATEVPAEFTHKVTGNSVTIPLAPGGEGTFSASSRVKACVLLSPIKDGRYTIDICYILRSKEGVEIDRIFIEGRISDLCPRSENLFVFRGVCHEVDVATSEIIFEFRCYENDDKIIECGVQILAEDAESSNSSEVDNFENFETGDNRNHHTDGDGDGDYETEAVMVSQGENIKTSKHTKYWSWLGKLGQKKKMNKRGQTSSGVS